MTFVLSSFHQKRRDFYRCARCAFYHVDPATQLSSKEESERYLFHENNSEDHEYRHYLSQLLLPIKNYLENHRLTQLYHLDFGSGKSNMAEQILKDWKLTTENSYSYDLYFSPTNAPLMRTPKNAQFDLVTAIEVVEHFRDPLGAWQDLVDFLKAGSLLYIGTHIFKNHPDEKSFGEWWYKNDPTHVSIYTHTTFEYIAEKFGLELIATDEKKYFLWRKK